MCLVETVHWSTHSTTYLGKSDFKSKQHKFLFDITCYKKVKKNKLQAIFEQILDTILSFQARFII